MTNKLITAFIDYGGTFASLEDAVTDFDQGYVVEGIRHNEGRDASGLHAGKGFGFDSEEAQVHTFTVEYTVTEEYVISLLPRVEEEQDNGNRELEDGDVVRPSEPESDSGLDEGVEPIEPVETVVDEQPEPPGDDEIAVPGEPA